MPPIRIALVGAGGVAERHASVLGAMEDVSIVGFMDVRRRTAEKVAEQVGTSAFTDLPELLDAAAPDAVYVCVPPFAHGDAERLLVERGIPFFVEKPLGAGIEVAEELGAAVAERGLLTATGYHWRYHEGVQRARELLDGRPVRLAVGAWLDKVPPVAWWLHQERSGGQLVEQATHLLDVMRDLVGEVDEVHAVGSRSAREIPGDVNDVTAATLRFAGGAVGSLAASSLLPAKHRAGLELVADGLRLVITETSLAVHDADGEATHSIDPDEAKRRVDRAFVDAVQGRGDDVRAPYEVALRTHRVACALARSAAGAATVDLRQPA